MATNSSGIAELYADVVADLIPYYDNMVLLPNPQLIVNSYNLTGAVGNTVKIPLTNSWPAGNTSISEEDDLIDAGFDFDPGSVSLAVNKKGAGTNVTEEALEEPSGAVTPFVIVALVELQAPVPETIFSELVNRFSLISAKLNCSFVPATVVATPVENPEVDVTGT